MKIKFSTLDIFALLPELNERCKGLRISNVYNINTKTYLLKLSKYVYSADAENEENEDVNKHVLLIESGSRLHLTEYDWPKEAIPNGFSMKLRKHLKNKRIESINPVGYDRIIDIQCGINEAAYHIILELYDKGNILITDCNYVILNLLRRRQDGENEDVKLLVKETYPIESLKNKNRSLILEKEEIQSILDQGKIGDNLKKLFNQKVIYGPTFLEHCFIECGLGINCKLEENKEIDANKIYESFLLAKEILFKVGNQRKGYIVEKELESQVKLETNEKKKIISYVEFNPINFNQYKDLSRKNQKLIEFDSFNKAIDIFFSSIETHKIDQRIFQKEKEAFKKLENIKNDHEKRLHNLEEQQKIDDRKGYLVEVNSELIEKALYVIRLALAKQMSWPSIRRMFKKALEDGDFLASRIKSLKFETNAFTMMLDDPYEQSENNTENKLTEVDISIELSAYGNARSYFENKKFAKKKEDKTIEASSKALKNAQLKASQALKEVKLKSNIIKTRKVFWFEKFYWFISSENYIVIAGRDAHQNEIMVKRYLKQGDLYVHADLHGASSVIIKNRNSTDKIPLKTIEEAGCMAVCYSSAWETKSPCKAWWVNYDQVSKTAPTGEYLTIGSFMIRGKKNYLPLTQLIMGFSFFYRISEECIINHVDDRKVKFLDCDTEQFENDANEFPDTKIKVDNAENHNQTILEALKPKAKQKSKTKLKNEKKIQEAIDKKTQNKNTINKIKKIKKKGKKEDYWSSDDEEDKITIKLNKKLQKDNRLMDLEEHIQNLKVDSQKNNLNESVDEDEISKEDNKEEKTDKKENEVNYEEIVNANINEEVESLNENEDNINSKDINSQPTNDFNNKKEEDSSSEEEKIDIAEEEYEEDEKNENLENKESEYLKIVNSLTGAPLPQDILLYAIPIVAPYNALQNVKKAKLVPDSKIKRGRCAKAVIEYFLRDKTISSREKDLIKAIQKDQDLARNLPNKVKLVATNLHNNIKRKK